MAAVITVAEIDRACARLRKVQAEVLAPMSQSDIVESIAAWALAWRAASSPWRLEAEALTEPFPFAMTRISLDALLESLTPDALWALIDAEGVRNAHGSALIGHVVAGSTPLLVWVSVLRALIMRSASFVKLPSGAVAGWGRLFLHSLAEASPPLAAGVHLAEWPGGTTELDAALCLNANLVLAYGGTHAMATIKSLCPPSTGMIAYGHRVSFCVVPQGAPGPGAATGLARDVLLYDQGGCLSPHTVFVEGDQAVAVDFAARLAEALKTAVADLPWTGRTAQAALRVREARAMAHMEPDTTLWEDPDLRWTVIARSDLAFVLSPTHGVVSVQPLDCLEALPVACAPVAGLLQGCAVASPERGGGFGPWRAALGRLGVSRVCRPGELQTPPFSWREDGRDLLRSLLFPPLPSSAVLATRHPESDGVILGKNTV